MFRNFACTFVQKRKDNFLILLQSPELTLLRAITSKLWYIRYLRNVYYNFKTNMEHLFPFKNQNFCFFEQASHWRLYPKIYRQLSNDYPNISIQILGTLNLNTQK